MALDFNALGTRIRVVRKKRGLSQNSLSEIIEKSPPYISYIESGVKSMSLETFVDIANALNTTADELLKDSIENTVIVTNNSFSEMITDCSVYEQRIILEVALAVKDSLRSNSSYFIRKIGQY